MRAEPSAPTPAGQARGGASPGRGRFGTGPGRGGRGRSAYATRDLTAGSIPKNLWFLAWPQTVEGALRVVDQLADLVWAGILGSRSIAGMGVAQQYSQMGFSARLGIDIGMRALVARAFGMGDRQLANRVVLQAGAVTLGYALIMIFIGVFLTEPLLHLLGVSDAVVEQGAPYMRVQFIGQAAIGFQMLAAHALAASGDTLTSMKATVVSRVMHFVLSPLLVFGLLGLPALGLAGAALANIIAHVFSLGILLYVLFSGTSRLRLSLRDFRFEWPVIQQLVKIGVPAGVNGMERSLAQIILVALVAPFGDYAIAAYTVTRRVEMFAHMGSQGLGNAAGIIVGHNLGARQPERAKQTVWWAAGYAGLINVVLSALVAAFPVAFLSLFNREPEFLEVARGWLVIQVVGYAAIGFGQVFAQSFQTAGDTLVVMFVNLGTIWLVQQPLAIFLPRATDLGQYGIAWATVATMLARPLFFVPYFLTERWMHVRVFAHEGRLYGGRPEVRATSPPK